MTTRIGKIARLPQHIREKLNRRLDDGEPGKQLVEWLNALPEVQEVLKYQFDARPITEQNLSEWKQGGHQDWLRHEESRDVVRRLTEEAQDLDSDAGDRAVSDRLSIHLTVELVSLARTLLSEASDPRERWQRLRELLQELGQLRCADHRAARLQVDQERWSYEADRLDEEARRRERQEMKDRAVAPIMALMKAQAMAPCFGGGEEGRAIAELMAENEYDLEPGKLSGRSRTGIASTAPVQPNPTESDSIQPDQTNCASGSSGK